MVLIWELFKADMCKNFSNTDFVQKYSIHFQDGVFGIYKPNAVFLLRSNPVLDYPNFLFSTKFYKSSHNSENLQCNSTI